MKIFDEYPDCKCEENNCKLSFDNRRYKDISKIITTRKIIKGEIFVNDVMKKWIKACDCIVYLEIKDNKLIILVELKDDK